jgi:hypothetical protein
MNKKDISKNDIAHLQIASGFFIHIDEQKRYFQK